MAFILGGDRARESARHFDISRGWGDVYLMTVDSSGNQAPSHAESVPGELMQFLNKAPGSLLIKGATGTGKTTLALSILRLLGPKGGFLYLSTRASPSQLFQYHPWLRGWLGPRKRKGRDGAEDAGIPESFVDCRLDEPTQLFERITNQLMDSTSPTIVIDTWDSLKDFREEDSLQSNLRVLLAWCERAGARLILVDEDPTNTAFDALVDGVVVLEQRDTGGRRAREVILSKLRGTEIRNPGYSFALKDARFRSAEPARGTHASAQAPDA
jgi:KaiC/GvpD/RAD55 family RecA-like ATPase